MLQTIDGIRSNSSNQTEEETYQAALDGIYSDQSMEEYHDHQTAPVYLQITAED